MYVEYRGRAHSRELGAEDFAKAGITDYFRDIVFLRNEKVEVPDELGKALVENSIFGLFVEVQYTPPEPVPTVNAEVVEPLDVELPKVKKSKPA